jgi:hypothetical protein
VKNQPLSIKILVPFGGIFALAILLLIATGCRSDYGVGSPYQPGPVAGKAVGNGVGVVAGNVAGAGVGVVQGTAAGAASVFNPNYHMVRYWRTETTADGRTIQVPYDVLVDQYGRPAAMPAPSGNPAPPPVAPPPPGTNAPGQ